MLQSIVYRDVMDRNILDTKECGKIDLSRIPEWPGQLRNIGHSGIAWVTKGMSCHMVGISIRTTAS